MARRSRDAERAAPGAVESTEAPASLDRVRRDVWAAWREAEPSAYEALRDRVLPLYRACGRRGHPVRPHSWEALRESARLGLVAEESRLHAALSAWCERYPLSRPSWAGDLALATLAHWSPPPPARRLPRGSPARPDARAERTDRRLAADRARRARAALEVPLGVGLELDSPGPARLLVALRPAEPALVRWEAYRRAAIAEAEAQIRAHWEARERALRHSGRYGEPALRYVAPEHVRWLVWRVALGWPWSRIEAEAGRAVSRGAIRRAVERLSEALGLASTRRRSAS